MSKRIKQLLGLLLLAAVMLAISGCALEEDKWIAPGTVKATLGNSTVTMKYLTRDLILSDPYFIDKSSWLDLADNYAAFYVTVKNGNQSGNQMVAFSSSRLKWGNFTFPLVESQFLKNWEGLGVLVGKTEVLQPNTEVKGVLVFPPMPLDTPEFKVTYPVEELKRDIVFTFGPKRDANKS